MLTLKLAKAKLNSLGAKRLLAICRDKIFGMPIEPLTHPSTNRIFCFGFITFAGHPFFFWIWSDVVPQPYENFTLRLVISLLGGGLMLPIFNRDPFGRLESFYFFAIFFLQLPCFFTWMYLCNNGNSVWLASISAMILIWFHVTDWRLATMGLTVGSAGAWLLFELAGPGPMRITSDQLLASEIVIGFCLTSGMTLGFSSANARQIQTQRTIEANSFKEREKLLTQLAGTIAHEIRNPLSQMNRILNNINYSLSHINLADTETRFFNEIHNNLANGLTAYQRGLQIVEMTLHEVTNQKLDHTNFIYLSAAEVTKKAINEFGFESQHEKNKTTLQVVSDFMIKVDETAFIYIIFNLLKNALYYFKSHINATITITIDQQKIIVTDTGPGIPEHVLNGLFKNFATVGKSNGTGLGLAYCHRTMQAFGGTIRCESVQGQYTSFILNFPFVPQDEIDAHTFSLLRRAARLFQKKRILVVDDQEIFHTLVKQMLEGLGCKIDAADGEQSALEFLKQREYDVVVMDIKMPGKDGFAVTEAIRGGIISSATNVAIVAHSSESPAAVRVRAQQVGMDGFISKPCSKLDLINALCCGIKSAEQRIYLEQNGGVLNGLTVLVTDDELFNRQYIEMHTNKWGMKTLHAESGPAALALLEKIASIKFILLDLRMPLMGGIEVTQRIRANPAYQDIIIIALTGDSSSVAIEESHKAGMNGFITKPVDEATLKQTLIDLLAMQTGEASVCVPHNVMMNPSTQTGQATEFGNRFSPHHAAQKAFFKELPLLDFERLHATKATFKAAFEDTVQSMINNLKRRQEELKTGIENNNPEAVFETLHSMLGVAGYVGAHALHQYVKLRLYPVAQTGQFPDEEAWFETVCALIAQSTNALHEGWFDQTVEV
ncbi:two-component system CAI-1 autoinducer sensor kinase/phosphatase CqsS [Oxalobacteraceae bacterium GrIS 1.18]